MAEIVGLNGLHNLEGYVCDFCAGPCDPQAQELNALDCTFSNCPSDASVYHQDCLEKYLKSIKLEKCVLILESQNHFYRVHACACCLHASTETLGVTHAMAWFMQEP
jgi:hypothetical protein